MQTFLFYDIETTGLNKAFDQVLQFAAIRTDTQLNELSRHELKIKLNCDVIPSAKAAITHQISLKEIENGVSELDAMIQIHEWFNTPGTRSVGYNTLGFDDEFLRFSFYRNLLPPYTHQYNNDCGRMDLYPIAVMYFLFKREILEWPTVNDKWSLKLEQLNRVNHLATGRAHDAMVDVEATLALARHFYKEHAMWTHLLGYFNKKTDTERTEPLQRSMALLFDGFLGSDQWYQCPVISLGQHHHYKNQYLWLQMDKEDLLSSTPDSFIKTTSVINKKMGEPSLILPMKERFMRHLTPERVKQAESNKKWLDHSSEVLSAIATYYKEYKHPVYPETDASARLYLDSFWTPSEHKFCHAFHQAPPNEKAKLTEALKPSTLKTLAWRMIARHYPEALTSSQSAFFEEYKLAVNGKSAEKKLIDYQGREKRNPLTALDEIHTLHLEPSLNEIQLALLEELNQYLYWVTGAK